MATVSIRVDTRTKEKLEGLRRPGQTLAGVVEEMVRFYERAETRPKRPPSVTPRIQ